MQISDKRRVAIENTMVNVKQALAQGADVSQLAEARDHLLTLAAQTDLFPEADFELPTGTQVERTIRLAQDEDGSFALYANVACHGQKYLPHDHGQSWAIVVAVKGREKHTMYTRTDDGLTPGIGRLKAAAALIVEPGHGVTLLRGGIHTIETVDDTPLLHLHCYGNGFEFQDARKEYDLGAGTYVFNNDIGTIEDMT